MRFSIRAIVLTVLATVVLVPPVFAQGFSVESKSPPSVVGAGPFVSLEGRFSIALPTGTHGYVYKYSGNQREELVYSADGSLNQRYIVLFDDKGNEVEQTSFETRDGSVRSKYSYAYEFDAKGNWTKRITSKSVTKDGKASFEPAYVTYRTIAYY